MEISRATWGDDNLVPPEAFRAIQESGNPLHGAFRDDRMIGFAIGWYGRDDDGWHLHSHQLAVLPDVRSKGIGYALKLAQRADVLADGVTRIRWTFDPLQYRNAYLNLTKLGATADAFHRDFYGEMPDDLNRGDRSDRLVVRWDLQGEPPLPGAPPRFERNGTGVLAMTLPRTSVDELKHGWPSFARRRRTDSSGCSPPGTRPLPS